MNPYCEALGVEPPNLDTVAHHREANTYARLLLALLERGAPMTLAQVAERLEQAGVAPAAAVLQSLKKCKPARAPIYRTGDEYALDPHDDEADLWAFRLGLRPPKVPRLQIARPEPEPIPDPDQPLSVVELDEAWKDASLFGSWSAQRVVVAVLEAHGRPMAPEEVIAFVDERTRWHFLHQGTHQFGRRRSAVQVDEAGRWTCVPGHDAIQGARKAVRKRLESARRSAAAHGTPAIWEANRLAAARRRAAHAAELVGLRRLIVHGYPADAPETVVLLDVNEHRIATLSRDDPTLQTHLDAADAIAALDVRAILQGLGYAHGARRLHELGPPQKTRRLNRRGRTLKITTDLLVQGSCGIARPFGDPDALRRYREQGQDTRLRRRLEADAKSLYALYEFGHLHGSLRLRWGFLDEWLPAPWVHRDEPTLRDLEAQALERGVPLEIVVGSAPGWTDPWARARKCVVRAGANPWERWLVDEDGYEVDEAEIQRARLAAS